jgi:aldehyde dehydrogenase (NAD+)
LQLLQLARWVLVTLLSTIYRLLTNASQAFDGSWRKVTPEERGKLLVKLSDLVVRDLDLLAAVESLDNGKSISMAKGDLGAVAGCLRYYGGWADKIEGKVIDTNSDTFSYTKQEPVSPPWLGYQQSSY